MLSRWCDHVELLVQPCSLAGATSVRCRRAPERVFTNNDRTLGRDWCERARSLLLRFNTSARRHGSGITDNRGILSGEGQFKRDFGSDQPVWHGGDWNGFARIALAGLLVSVCESAAEGVV